MTVITDPVEQYNLITKGLQETLNGQIIKDVLEKENRPVKIYWGTAPTGKTTLWLFRANDQIGPFLKSWL